MTKTKVAPFYLGHGVCRIKYKYKYIGFVASSGYLCNYKQLVA